jgi:hypothetical protein
MSLKIVSLGLGFASYFVDKVIDYWEDIVIVQKLKREHKHQHMIKEPVFFKFDLLDAVQLTCNVLLVYSLGNLWISYKELTNE